MSRTGIPGLASPRPLIGVLPSLYQEDEFAARFTGAFDEILAAVISTIDNVPAYLDPALTPEDFIDWLASWVGVLLDETWPIERRRAFVAEATDLYRHRGTARGLAHHIRVFTSGDVQIVESGAAAWSPESGAAAPGTGDFTVNVRLRVPASTTIEESSLDALVAAAKPAHMRHTIEVIKV